ncbi:glycosyltransferase family 4 protein [Flammeovirga sp. SJP92]|uniref:glycosyltransferase family 4 protein n=1 Tax=Flammeovirga sp. SJP92 TaxID=1775430 RepID=UPI0007881CBA|nr:glycosyltransferase family 4 protein [Flammeovirga sp. SJP92]KXX68509.1 hypothetical protein AVL50_22350 [Flammeovirga sp. SJP92]
MKKIAFISQDDPNDKRAWSGTAHTIFMTLKKDFDVYWHGKIELSKSEKASLFFNKYVNKIGKGRLANERNLEISKVYSSKMDEFIASQDFDYIFVCAVPFMGAFIKNTTIPMIYLNDATFENMIDFYAPFMGLSKKGIKEGHEIERALLKRASKVVYSSQWAVDSAVNYYNADKNKVSFIDFGANLPLEDYTENIPSEYVNNKCRLLFSGVDWKRKGGETALAITRELTKRGINTELVIIGCNPSIRDKNVTIIPFLNKNIKKDLELFTNYFKNSTFFVLPTVADCTPIVFSESGAYSLPVITTKVGGTESVILEGKNGYTFDLNATPSEYADTIEKLWNDKEKLISLRKSSLNEYHSRLNWGIWRKKFNELLNYESSNH